MKFFQILLTIALCLFLPHKSQAAEGTCDYPDKIIFSGLDWDSNRFHNAVARFILENGYGCETDVIPGTTLPLLTALAKGDVHVTMEIWEENIREAWAKMTASGKVQTLGVTFPDATQGFFVPTYVLKGDPERGIEAVAPALKSVRDLPQYKDIFADPEIEGKGRFYNCILGWSCEEVNTKKLKAYGLNEHYSNFRPGASASLAAAISSAYQKGEPILAYYWGPTWVLGKYDLTMLEEPAYDKDIWNELMASDEPSAATAYPVVVVKTGANSQFVAKAPNVAEFLRRYEVTSDDINKALVYLKENEGSSIEDAAIAFLKKNPDIWKAWLEQDKIEKVSQALGEDEGRSEDFVFHIDQPINDFISYLVREHEDFFSALSVPLLQLIILAENILLFPPWWLFILLAAFGTYFIERKIRLPIITTVSLGIIMLLGMWQMSMETLALMLISTLVSIVVGIPCGILISFNEKLKSATLPILDAMQTMPSFVYLIPALMLFGLGKVPALFACVIYAVTPLIRLTNHGIQMVDGHIIEASRAYGASRWQLLFDIQLPLAIKTIMAGINQTTMLALSMVVVASMIGSRGLGEQVLLGIQKLDVGKGFTAGIGIVALAILLDRTTQAIGNRMNSVK